MNTSTARRKALAQAHFATGLSVTGRPRSRLGWRIVAAGSPARMLSRLKYGAARKRLACQASRKPNQRVFNCGWTMTAAKPNPRNVRPIRLSHWVTRKALRTLDSSLDFGVRRKTPFFWISPWKHARVTAHPRLKKLYI